VANPAALGHRVTQYAVPYTENFHQEEYKIFGRSDPEKKDGSTTQA
jgi:hypothetical protein